MNTKHARKYNIKFLVSVSTLIIIGIWVAWIIKYNPYGRTTAQPGILDKTIQATNDWRDQIKDSQLQLETLEKFINGKFDTATSSATTTPLNISPDLIDSMKNYLSSSTATTTPF